MALLTVAQGGTYVFANLIDANGVPLSSAAGLSDGNALSGQYASDLWLWNGSSWDKGRNNLDGITLINASAVTTTQTSADQVNFNAKGCHIWLNITALTAGSVQLILRGRDPVSGQYLTIISGAAIAATGFTAIEIGPGITPSANVAAATQLPRTWDVQAVVVTGPATFTVAVSLNV